MRTPKENRIEVDMVPMIDIISLLLMFLIVVGEVGTNDPQMRLPRADQALQIVCEGRLAINLEKVGGICYANIFNKRYALGPTGTVNESLAEHLTKHIAWALAHARGRATAASIRR
ncbi:MAG TPA: biopolymer transporter ExbD [Planctomycetota bacterium]|jgi:biopolymer transport protein ExbD